MADEDVTVRVGAHVGGLKSGMADAGRTVAEITEHMRYSLRRMGEMSDGWQIRWNQGLELAGRAAQLFEATWDATVGNVIRRGEEFDAMGKRLSTPVEELTKIEFAAKQAGVGLETIITGYRSASKVLVEGATAGTDANRLLVQGLGLTGAEIERLKGLAPHEVILELGAALEKYEDGADKAAAGQALFGRGYTAVLQLLREGPETIRENIALSERLGLVMSTDQAAAADRLGDSIGTLHAAWEGFFQRMFGDEDLLNDLAETIETVAENFGDMTRAIPDDEVDGLRDAIRGLNKELADLLPTGSSVASVLTTIANGIKTVIDYREVVEGGLAGMLTGGLAMGPVGMVGGGLAGMRAGGIARQKRLDDMAPVTEAQAALAEAEEALRRKAGVTGLGMTDESGVEVPSSPDLVLPPPQRAPTATTRPAFVTPTDPSKGDNAASKARAEEFAAILREQQRRLAAEKDNAEQRLTIVSEFTERIKARFGEESQEFDRQKLVQIQAEEQAKSQRDQLSLGAIEAEKTRKLAEIELERDNLAFKKQMGQISDDEEITALQALYDRRYDVLVEAIARERELAGDDPVKQQRLDGEEGQAKGANEEDQLALLQQQQLEVKETFDQVFGAIGQSFDRTILGMIQGTQTWGQAVGSIGQNVLGQMISLGIQMVVRWAANKAAELLIDKTVNQAKVASATQAQAAKTAAEAPEIIKQITNNAYGAASGGANAMSSIPYVGPILAVANAAALFAMVIGYATSVSSAGGLDEVPSGGAFAMLHPKETVLSAGLAERFRRASAAPEEMEAAGGRSAAGRGGGHQINITAMDGPSVEEFLNRHGDAFIDMLERRRGLRHGA